MLRSPRQLLALPLLAVVLVPTFAQGQLPWSPDSSEADPIRQRQWAKERFRTAQAGLDRLAAEKREKARAASEAAEQVYLAGREGMTAAVLLRQTAALEESGPAAPGRGAMIALARQWNMLVEAEKIALACFQAGRIPIADLAQAQCERLAVQLRLVRDHPGWPAACPSWENLPDSRAMRTAGMEESGLRERRFRARQGMETSTLSERELRQQLINASQVYLLARTQEYAAGRQGSTLDRFLSAALSLQDPDAPNRGEAPPRTLLEVQYLLLAEAFEACVNAFNSGRISMADLASADHARLLALERLIAAGKPANAKRPRTALVLPFAEASLPFQDEVSRRAAARRILQVSAAARDIQPETLRRQKLQAAEQAFTARLQEYTAGREGATLDRVMAWSLLPLEASPANHPSGVDLRLLALRRYRSAWEIQQITAARYHAGRVAVEELFKAECGRLEEAMRFLRQTPR